MTRLLLVAIVLAGCAKDRAQMRTLPTAPLQETPCSDAALQSLCTPAETSRPVRVDTNLHSERQVHTHAA